MTTARKIPLANNPNAANSPYRGLAAAKRSRANTNDLENDGSPPKKKQLIDISLQAARPSALRAHTEEPTGDERPTARHVGSRRPLPETKDTKAAVLQNGKKVEKPAAASDKEALQNWKRHYRRTFPTFVFYFESLPSDSALRLGRQAVTLGAKVEKFFSKDITHVITTRQIPSASDTRAKPRVETIDPSVLSHAEVNGRSRPGAGRSQALNHDARGSTTNDVLSKAKEMGIKIWNIEKFERMTTTLFSHDGSDDDDAQSRRIAQPSLLPMKREAEPDLSQLLRNERKNAPVDRKPWQDIIPFRGVYVYIHDMDERTKPIMVREYNRPAQKEDGKWPMLRSVSNGRCPFVEEPRASSRDENDSRKVRGATAPAQSKSLRTTAKDRPRALEAVIEAPRTRSTTQSPQKQKAALQEAGSAVNQMPKPHAPASMTKTAEAPSLQRQASGSTVDMPAMLGSTHASYQGLPRRPGGEPLASGMQANVTSAIRSQMYSSTAPSAGPQRVGMSKQQHQMSRRILEKQTGLSNSTLPSSVNVSDLRAAINKDQNPTRTTRVRGTTGRLTKIHEDEAVTEEEEEWERTNASTAARKKAPVKRDPKPGYCENCRDKYDDFSEHIVSKTHRKFATSSENFADLDKLLKMLVRR